MIKEKTDVKYTSETDLKEMSQEELLAFALKADKKSVDQEAARKKRETELDLLRKEIEDEGKSTTPDKATETEEKEEPKQESGLSLDEVRLASTLSNEEIAVAKKVAESFGMSLVEASQSDAFKAHIKKSRETSESEGMSIDDITTLNSKMTDEEFMDSVNAGDIDISSGKNRDRALKIAQKEIQSYRK